MSILCSSATVTWYFDCKFLQFKTFRSKGIPPYYEDIMIQDLHVLPFLWQLKYHSGQNKVLPYLSEANYFSILVCPWKSGKLLSFFSFFLGGTNGHQFVANYLFNLWLSPYLSLAPYLSISRSTWLYCSMKWAMNE